MSYSSFQYQRGPQGFQGYQGFQGTQGEPSSAFSLINLVGNQTGGHVQADVYQDTLTLSGGDNIRIVAVPETDTITISSNSAVGFKTIDFAGASTGDPVVADQFNDTLTLYAGDNMRIVSNPATDTITFSSNSAIGFRTISLTGAYTGDPIIADQFNDTLTISAGDNMYIVSNSATDTITFSSNSAVGFRTIALTGLATGDPVIADQFNDTLTISAGPRIAVESVPATDMLALSGYDWRPELTDLKDELRIFSEIQPAGNAGGTGIIQADSNSDRLDLSAGPNMRVEFTAQNDLIGFSARGDVVAHEGTENYVPVWVESKQGDQGPMLGDSVLYQLPGKIGINTSQPTKALHVAGDTYITGDLTVDGTATTINSVTMTVDDKNIELASTSSPSDVASDGGGLTLKGTTDKSFNWYNINDAWTSSEHLSTATTKDIRAGRSLYANTVNEDNTLSGTLLAWNPSSKLVQRVDANELILKAHGTDSEIQYRDSSTGKLYSSSLFSFKSNRPTSSAGYVAVGYSGFSLKDTLANVNAWDIYMSGSTLAFDYTNIDAVSLMHRFEAGGRIGFNNGGTFPSNTIFDVATVGTNTALFLRGHTSDGHHPCLHVRNETYNVEAKINAEDSDGTHFGSFSNHKTHIIVNNSRKMTVDTNGRVGIGTTAPSYQFQTTSDAWIGNNLWVNNVPTNSATPVLLGWSTDDRGVSGINIDDVRFKPCEETECFVGMVELSNSTSPTVVDYFPVGTCRCANSAIHKPGHYRIKFIDGAFNHTKTEPPYETAGHSTKVMVYHSKQHRIAGPIGHHGLNIGYSDVISYTRTNSVSAVDIYHDGESLIGISTQDDNDTYSNNENEATNPTYALYYIFDHGFNEFIPGGITEFSNLSSTDNKPGFGSVIFNDGGCFGGAKNFIFDGGSGNVGIGPKTTNSRLSAWYEPTNSLDVWGGVTIGYDYTDTPYDSLSSTIAAPPAGMLVRGDTLLGNLTSKSSDYSHLRLEVDTYTRSISGGYFGNVEVGPYPTKFTSVNVISGDYPLWLNCCNTNHVIAVKGGGNMLVGTIADSDLLALSGASKFNVNGNTSIGSGYYLSAAPGNGLAVQGSAGIGTTGPGSKLGVLGNTTIGTTYAELGAPGDGLAVEGSVGIGTRTPGSKLGVKGNTSIGSGYSDTAAPSNGLIVEGDVGIHTSSPSYELHLVGDEYVTGHLGVETTPSNSYSIKTGYDVWVGDELFIATTPDSTSTVGTINGTGKVLTIDTGTRKVCLANTDELLKTEGAVGGAQCVQLDSGSDPNNSFYGDAELMYLTATDVFSVSGASSGGVEATGHVKAGQYLESGTYGDIGTTLDIGTVVAGANTLSGGNVLAIDGTRVKKIDLEGLVTWFKITGDVGNFIVKDETNLSILGESGVLKTEFTGSVLYVQHENSGVTAGTYGSKEKVSVVTVDAHGHVTAAADSDYILSGLDHFIPKYAHDGSDLISHSMENSCMYDDGGRIGINTTATSADFTLAGDEWIHGSSYIDSKLSVGPEAMVSYNRIEIDGGGIIGSNIVGALNTRDNSLVIEDSLVVGGNNASFSNNDARKNTLIVGGDAFISPGHLGVDVSPTSAYTLKTGGNNPVFIGHELHLDNVPSGNITALSGTMLAVDFADAGQPAGTGIVKQVGLSEITGPQGPQGYQGEAGEKYAIVPTSVEGEYVGLFCSEMPVATFEDIVKVEMRANVECYVINQTFVDVCTPNSIVATGIVPSSPCLVGAKVTCNTLQVSVEGKLPDYVVVKLSGTRRDSEKRFPKFTKSQAERNTKFWDQWKV